MSLEVIINSGSLVVVREELGNLITQSATDFEAYLADQSASAHIDTSLEKMAQVGGIFRLLEYPGAARLADEMAALLAVIADPERANTEAMINALTHAYFVLPRYIEYVAIKQFELPILMVPYINELRLSHKLEILPEQHFYQGTISLQGELPASSDTPDISTITSTVPRLSHMYQTGLVGVIKDPGNRSHYLFMRRALTRFVKLLGNHPQREFWLVAEAVLEAFVVAELEVTLNRKRILGDIEKLLRKGTNLGAEGLSEEPRDGLKSDMLFLLLLAGDQFPSLQPVRQAFALGSMATSDAYIAAERLAMHGPSLDTIQSVIKVLTEELRNAKDILEVASQNSSIEQEDQTLLKSVLLRVADTLGVLNLTGPQNTLKEQLTVIDGWGDDANIGNTDILEIADAVLYVESALSGLDRREFTVDELNQANQIARKKVIASGQLAEAQSIVIEEAQSGIAMAKRAITSYVDSKFDFAHIANVATSLNTVRGGLFILRYHRAAAILKGCSEFLAHHVSEGATGQRHQLLETLADALISLEYYLNELATTHDANDKILDVAEESLTALGYNTH